MSKGNVDAFLKALFQREAGGNTKVINYAGYIGKYQFGESALIDLGYYTADGTTANDWNGSWTGKHGIGKRSEFLNSEAAQDVAAREWVALLCKRMKNMKLNAFIGKTINGIEITESGIIAGAHLKGFGNEKHPGVAKFLRSNGVVDPEDGLKTKVSHYVELFADYDLGCCSKLSVVFAEKKTGASIPNLPVQVKKNGKIHTTVKTDDNGFLPALHGFSAGDQYEILVARLAGGFKSLKLGIMKDVDSTLAFLSPKAKASMTTELHKGQPVPRRPIATTTTSHPKAAEKAVSTPSRLPHAIKQPVPEASSKRITPVPEKGDVALQTATTTVAQKSNEPSYSITPVTPDQLDIDSAVWERLRELELIEPASLTEPNASIVAENVQATDLGVEESAEIVAINTTAQVIEVPVAPLPTSATSNSAPAPVSATTPSEPTIVTAAPQAAKKPQSAKSPPVVEIEKTRSANGHPKAVAKPTPARRVNTNTMPMQKTIPGLLFPLEKRPTQSYKDGARFFGAGRSGGRKHGGIDLYAPVGTPVRAMADGKVIQVYPFYLGTWVVEVDHGTFIARYGEVSAKNIKVKKHDQITRGEQLGIVGLLQGLSFSMLHLEMYATTESPLVAGLTQRQMRPFQRRKDLIDPTASIDLATLE
jgi:murein DD-endopeptidase MepM/ murein hydrolase activator NlpD